MNEERCPDFEKILATQEDFEEIKEGQGGHLCWRKYHVDVCPSPIDWRGRAEQYKEKLNAVRKYCVDVADDENYHQNIMCPARGVLLLLDREVEDEC